MTTWTAWRQGGCHTCACPTCTGVTESGPRLQLTRHTPAGELLQACSRLQELCVGNSAVIDCSLLHRLPLTSLELFSVRLCGGFQRRPAWQPGSTSSW